MECCVSSVRWHGKAGDATRYTLRNRILTSENYLSVSSHLSIRLSSRHTANISSMEHTPYTVYAVVRRDRRHFWTFVFSLSIRHSPTCTLRQFLSKFLTRGFPVIDSREHCMAQANICLCLLKRSIYIRINSTWRTPCPSPASSKAPASTALTPYRKVSRLLSTDGRWLQVIRRPSEPRRASGKQLVVYITHSTVRMIHMKVKLQLIHCTMDIYLNCAVHLQLSQHSYWITAWEQGFASQQEQDIFLYFTACGPALGYEPFLLPNGSRDLLILW
jgi:hypothetical protein